MNCEVCTHTADKKYSMESLSPDRMPTLVESDIINQQVKNNPLALSNSVWSSKTIYWKRESSYPWIDDKTMDKMIRAAFLEASIHTPLIIQQRNRKMSDAHIIINWLGKKDERYFTSPSILAFGYGPGYGLGGNVTMNADVLWLLRRNKLLAPEAKALGYIENYSDARNEIRYYDPLHTMKHEGAGHALGMRHIETITEKMTAIMYPYYNGLRRFGDADLKYLETLYGKANIKKELLDYLRLKILNFQ